MEFFSTYSLIVFVATITPGPNNFIVMNIATKESLYKVTQAILGVLMGSVALVFFAWAGVVQIVEQYPIIKKGIILVGSSYLVYLGISLMFLSGHKQSLSGKTVKRVVLPSSFIAIFLFQFTNPKAWVMITTISTELSNHHSGYDSLIIMLLNIILISSISLFLWAKIGSYLSRFLEKPNHLLIFNIIMATLLIISALIILINI